MGSTRRKPNILVTGTPGTGKTTTCSLLADHANLNLRHINLGELVRQKNLHDGWDDEFQSYILNEDLVNDELEGLMVEGGNIVDYHSCDFFPERWFDCVVVLQTDNSVLYDRLTNRGYMGQKLQNNIECEIFQVLLEDAHNSYSEDIVIPLRSDTIEDAKSAEFQSVGSTTNQQFRLTKELLNCMMERSCGGAFELGRTLNPVLGIALQAFLYSLS